MKYFKENANYVYDLETIFEFISDSKRKTDSEITELFVTDDNTNKLNLSTRELREVKSSDATDTAFRYDMVKSFMEVFNSINPNIEPPTLGEITTINSLLNEGFIKEINEEQDGRE